MRCRTAATTALSFALAAALPAHAQQADTALFAGLRWRLIGPFRGGRTVAAVGVHGQPTVFYIGVNNGGVWRSADYGRTWTPIFDDQPTGSIGAIAVAPSDPNTIYVGSGEGLQRPDLSTGDGIYRSSDGGRTWRHLGLADGQQIAQIIVDPADRNRLFVAVMGHPYGPNETRGIYRSTDGGETWQKVLYKDANAGGMDLAFDPVNSQTVYAVLWAARQAPWEIGSSWTISADNGLYKSTDGGTTWRPITAGLPTAQDSLGRIGIAVAPGAPSRLYAVVGATKGGGLYRSDDGGEHWRLANADERLWRRDGDFNEVKVDSHDPDVVYVANIVTWKSTDGGKTFSAWRGAPGGDDYHRLWIDPEDPRVILLAGDQGAIVTVNGGETWSSWYNQPTAQFYHVTTDNRFPYWVYGGQQESGSAAIASRGNDGQITFREWHPVGAEEYGYIAPDPLHPGIVYGGRVQRFDWNTGDVQDVAPEPVHGGAYRYVRTLPLLFSPLDPHILYFGTNVLWATSDGGHSWRTLSPDLTRASYAPPANLGDFASLDPEHGKHRGVIYTIAPSPRRLGLLWVGTDDGLIHVTHDGGRTWKDVTPAALTPWSKVSVMEASHHDTLEAFAAVNRFRLDDLRPHVYRTRDDGRTWTEITAGIPDDQVVNAVREDPVRKGLLFAATERTVYASFDDGDHWQSLRLNLPPSSVRDLAIHESDLIAGTHGRAFWILDDITPLRQLRSGGVQGTVLFRPARATRVRWNRNTDTPLPPDEPAGRNPPDGAVIDYVVASGARGPATLEIRDASGRLVRRFSSEDVPEPPDTSANIPQYWVRPSRTLSASAGAHRFVWDLRYPPPPVAHREYPISAVIHDTPLEPRGPWVVPGTYTVVLRVDGRVYRAPLTVRMDPRVPTAPAALAAQLALAQRCVAALRADSIALADIRSARTRLGPARSGARDSLASAIDSLAHQLDRLQSASAPVKGFGPLGDDLAGLYGALEGSDAAPTTQQVAALARLESQLADAQRRWGAVRAGPLADLERHGAP